MSPEFSARITTAPDVMVRIIGDEAVLLNPEERTLSRIESGWHPLLDGSS